MTDAEPVRPPSRVGIRDVAKATGLSTTSVSHALSGRQRVSADVHSRVHAAAERMGYSGSPIARALRTGRTDTIGFISTGLVTQPHGGQMLLGAQDAAIDLGKVLIIVNVPDSGLDTSEPHIAALLNQQVDGFVLGSIYHRLISVPPALSTQDVVLLNCQDPLAPRPAVVPDEAQIGRDAAQLLLAQGHRHIAHLTINQHGPAVDDRAAGFASVLAAHGREATIVAVPGPADARAGRDALARALQARPETTAAFCFNDQMAMGAYQRAGALGRQVPETLSVVGVDNLALIAPELQPPLTTIALPHYEMGQVTLRLLVEGQRSAGELLKRAGGVIIRDSVGAPANS